MPCESDYSTTFLCYIQDEMIVCMKIIMMYLRTLITKKKQRRDINKKRDVKFGFILMMNSCGKLKYRNLEGIQLRGQNSIE